MKNLIHNLSPTLKILFILITIALLLRLPMIYTGYIDYDDFQHLHAARSIHQGMIPYRDFFEHHTPILHFLLAPLYGLLGDNISIIFFARCLILIFTIFLLYITYRLGKLLYGFNVSLYAVYFLCYLVIFLYSTLEIRPDMLGASFWLLSLILFILGIKNKGRPKSTNTYFFVSGIMISIAVLFTQKCLFAAMGLLSVFIWMVFDKRVNLPLKKIFFSFLFFMGGLLIPFSIVCLYFTLNKSLYQFIYCNFILNAKWPHRFLPIAETIILLKTNPFFSMLGFISLIVITNKLRHKDTISNGSFVSILSTYALIIGLFIIPVPHLQYFMLFSPMLAIYSGYTFNFLMEHFSWSQIQKLWQKKEYPLIGFIFLGIAVTFILFIYVIAFANISILTPLKNRFFYFWMWLFIIAFITYGLIKNIKKDYMAIALLLGITVYPLDQMFALFLDISPFSDGTRQCLRLKRQNRDQLNKIQFILENTTPQDTVLNGGSDVGVFRDHVYYYYFLREDIKKTIDPKKLSNDIIDILQNKKPKIIIRIEDIQPLSLEIQNYIKKHYKFTGIKDIYMRIESD